MKTAGLALAVTVALLAPALASADDAPLQSSSVQVYTNQAVPVALPPGVQPDTPLKAGQMTLQDVLQAHPSQKSQPSQVSATAPVLAPSSGASAERLMMMQGMESALQEPLTNKPSRLKPPQLQTGIAPSMQPNAETGMTAITSASAPGTSSAAGANIHYQPGQEPKNLAAGASGTGETSTASNETSTPPMPEEKPSQTPSAETTAAAPAASGTTVAPAATETAASSQAPAATEAPKATDLEQAPTSLDEMASTPSSTAPAAPSEAAALQSSSGESGNVAMEMRQAAQNPAPTESAPAPEAPTAPQPASESASAPEASAAPVPSTQASASSASGCQPHVESWTKTCSEAGYPSSYIGKITGETRTVCPQGDLQDVWLENSCTPPPDNAAAAPPVPPAKPAETAAPESAPPAPAETASAAAAETPAPSPAEAPPPEKPAELAQVAVPELKEAPPAAAADSGTPLDANCGAASGLAVSSKPASDLCLAGTPSDVTGDGPWRWECNGANGGMTVSCAAPLASAEKPSSIITSPSTAKTAAAEPEDGACGMANGAGLENAPVADLCMKGVASRVNGGGPWTWACSGVNGGKATACAAQKKSDGACGKANGAGFSEMPVADLCASGLASAVTGDGPWSWTCAGLYGGAAATCSAQAKKAAVCGSATLDGHKEAPTDNLCTTGTASAVNGNGPWSWTCEGLDGGASVNCEAKISVNGACGSANGVAANEAPGDGLCSSGKATRVLGDGPWNWSCTGLNDGDTQSCTAPKAVPENTAAANTPVAPPATAEQAGATPSPEQGLCGTATNVASVEKPSDNLCAGGVAGKVKSEKHGWVWECHGAQSGMSVSCSAPHMKASGGPAAAAVTASAGSESNGPACGAASGHGSLARPSEDLCAAGKATIVRGRGPWNWKCVKGKKKASCEAAKQVDAVCGSANGSMQKTAPVHGLCAAGTPTQVAGQGPWLWTCVGGGGGASISCSAASQTQERVDGACGAASNTPMTMAPASNLCDSGSPSSVYGDGPWTWTCSGLNGGVAASCESRKVVPNAPAPPGPAVNGLCGAANGVAAVVQPVEGLCSTGTVTAVSGDGPWNWDCLGQNGGMTVSCTAPLMPPAPVTGACGAASGQPTLTMPQSGLCSAGISSAVSGNGPWTWSCSGTNGGGAVACVAPLATSGGGPLPGIVTAPSSTASGEAPVPAAAPTAPVSAGLVTPTLPSGPLPPLETGTMPPAKPFPPAPTGASAPSETAMQVSPMSAAPPAEPGMPEDNNPLEPPPVRDTIKPSPALKPPAIDSEGNLIPGNHFVLDDDISSLPFTHGSENIDNNILPALNKLAAVLKAHGNVRVTLTAYAGLDSNSSPRDARRLSLGRALAVRDYLTAAGISSGRIDVRALGANVVTGDADRVDVRAN